MRQTAVVFAAFILCVALRPDDPGALTGGSLTAEQERNVLEVVVRYEIRAEGAPCKNYGSKAAYCLSVRGQEPEAALLKRFGDLKPPVLSLSQCQQEGVVGRVRLSTDPAIDIERLKVVPEGVKAGLTVYCSRSSVSVALRGSQWVITGGGSVASCLLPGDCQH